MSESSYRVLGINGSPRGDQGITDIVMRRFLKGAEAAGAETDIVYPAKMKIAHCLGDLDCWLKTGGQCRHKDDMPMIALKYAMSDLLVFACPVYVDGMTSHMKKMFERFLCYSPPFVEYVDHRTVHPKAEADVKDHKVVAISTCGFPEREHFEALSLHYKRLCQNLHAQLIGEFYFPGSSILTNRPFRRRRTAGRRRAGRARGACHGNDFRRHHRDRQSRIHRGSRGLRRAVERTVPQLEETVPGGVMGGA